MAKIKEILSPEELRERNRRRTIPRKRELKPEVKTALKYAGKGIKAIGGFAKEEFRLQRRELMRSQRRPVRRYRRPRRYDPFGVGQGRSLLGIPSTRQRPLGRNGRRPQKKKLKKQKFIIRGGRAYPVVEKKKKKRRRRYYD